MPVKISNTRLVMAIKIYNSLKREKEEFEPIKPPNVNIYTCGVTVYDECHIGHARSLYIFDVMRRYLRYRGYKVKFVRNITDIDDKIINRANELKVDWKELVEKYVARYYEDLKALGIEKGTYEPRATENIPEMIKYIKALIDKGYAYEAGGDVYFSVRKFSGYGKLSGQSIDQMETGVRIDPTEHKKDPLDFALWKKSKEGEPFWASLWGNGRPGWHIECSVMSQKFLKTDTLDIHAGGRDLIFPHHENEIAQAEVITGKPFAKYWIHHGLLTINSQKMAKSLGNFITIKNFADKYKNMNLLKIFFLSAHYSHPIDYTEEKIEEANKRYERLCRMLEKAEIIFKSINSNKLKSLKHEVEKDNRFAYMKANFENAMDDDLNMPQALAVLDGLITWNNTTIDYGLHIKHKEQLYYNCHDLLPHIMEIFGLSVTTGFIEDLTTEEKQLMDDYQKARSEKDYKISDEKRTQLNKLGIIIEETKDGTSWRRKV